MQAGEVRSIRGGLISVTGIQMRVALLLLNMAQSDFSFSEDFISLGFFSILCLFNPLKKKKEEDKRSFQRWLIFVYMYLEQEDSWKVY